MQAQKYGVLYEVPINYGDLKHPKSLNFRFNLKKKSLSGGFRQ
jgi:hypothetical protein